MSIECAIERKLDNFQRKQPNATPERRLKVVCYGINITEDELKSKLSKQDLVWIKNNEIDLKTVRAFARLWQKGGKNGF